jgi:deoxyribodipyrimidine photo-lyase
VNLNQVKNALNLLYTKKWVKNLNKPDYSSPIVEHKFARERFLKVFKTTLENYKI